MRRWMLRGGGAVMVSALLSLASVPAAAQAGRVIGRVTDAAGNPVAGAHVELVAPDSTPVRAATTGETGGFDFGAVPAGRYTLRTAAPGFRPRELRVELAPHGRETLIARLRPARGDARLAETPTSPRR